MARALTEAKIEGTVSEWAKDMGIDTLKLNVRGQRGTPDRLYLLSGKVLFIEFKKPGEKPTTIQRYRMNQLRARGFDAVAVDDIEMGKRLIGRYLLGWAT